LIAEFAAQDKPFKAMLFTNLRNGYSMQTASKTLAQKRGESRVEITESSRSGPINNVRAIRLQKRLESFSRSSRKRLRKSVLADIVGTQKLSQGYMQNMQIRQVIDSFSNIMEFGINSKGSRWITKKN